MNSFPFTSLGNDRKVKTADFRELFKKYFTNGVFMNPSTNLQILENSGMTVLAKSGSGNINGTFGYENEDRVVNIQEAEAKDRIDRIVLRWNDNVNSRKMEIYVIKGIASDSPIPPALVRNQSVYDLSLATVYVSAYSTNITQSKITDTRLDASVCGVVSGTIKEADTTTLYAQIQDDLKGFKENEQAEFMAWFEQIKGQLSTDQAGNLQLQIDELKSKIEDNTNHLKGLAPLSLTVNSDFQCWQRGEKLTVENGKYGADMWRVFCTGQATISKNTKGLKVDSVSGTLKLSQYLTDKSLQGKQITIVKSIDDIVTKETKTVDFGGTGKFEIFVDGLKNGNIVNYCKAFEGTINYPCIKEDSVLALMRCYENVYITEYTPYLKLGYDKSFGDVLVASLQLPFPMKGKPTVIVDGTKKIFGGNKVIEPINYFLTSTMKGNSISFNLKNAYGEKFDVNIPWSWFVSKITISCEPL